MAAMVASLNLLLLWLFMYYATSINLKSVKMVAGSSFSNAAEAGLLGGVIRFSEIRVKM